MSALSNVPSNIRTISRWPVAVVLTLGVLTAGLFVTSDASAQSSQRDAGAAASRVPYQAYLTAQCLSGGNFCKFSSDTVPSGQLLEVQRVACQGWVVSTEPPSFVGIAELRTGADVYIGRIDFLRTTYGPANGGFVWAISEQTLMFVPAGQRLRITLNSGFTTLDSYGCTISGYLTAA